MSRDRKKYLNRGYWAGVSIPIVLFGLFFVFRGLGILGENPFTSGFVFALALVQLPVSIIGRALNLPIESGRAGFMLVDFNIWGHVLTFAFWGALGVLLGWIASMFAGTGSKIE